MKYFKRFLNKIFKKKQTKKEMEAMELRARVNKAFNPVDKSDPDLHVVIARYDGDKWWYLQLEGSWICPVPPDKERLEMMWEAKKKNPQLVYGLLPRAVIRFPTKSHAVEYWDEFRVRDGLGRIESHEISYLPISEYYCESETLERR